MAAKAGDAEAKYEIAQRLGFDNRESLALLKAAAEQNYAKAIWKMGELHRSLDSMPGLIQRDCSKAADELSKAAELFRQAEATLIRDQSLFKQKSERFEEEMQDSIQITITAARILNSWKTFIRRRRQLLGRCISHACTTRRLDAWQRWRLFQPSRSIRFKVPKYGPFRNVLLLQCMFTSWCLLIRATRTSHHDPREDILNHQKELALIRTVFQCWTCYLQHIRIASSCLTRVLQRAFQRILSFPSWRKSALQEVASKRLFRYVRRVTLWHLRQFLHRWNSQAMSMVAYEVSKRQRETAECRLIELQQVSQRLLADHSRELLKLQEIYEEELTLQRVSTHSQKFQSFMSADSTLHCNNPSRVQNITSDFPRSRHEDVNIFERETRFENRMNVLIDRLDQRLNAAMEHSNLSALKKQSSKYIKSLGKESLDFSPASDTSSYCEYCIFQQHAGSTSTSSVTDESFSSFAGSFAGSSNEPPVPKPSVLRATSPKSGFRRLRSRSPPRSYSTPALPDSFASHYADTSINSSCGYFTVEDLQRRDLQPQRTLSIPRWR